MRSTSRANDRGCGAAARRQRQDDADRARRICPGARLPGRVDKRRSCERRANDARYEATHERAYVAFGARSAFHVEVA